MTDHDAAHIPAPQEGDNDEVEIALETSRSLWAKGDGREALRWLRRAADAAEQGGDDRRQLELARAAADLTAVVGPSMAPQPPSHTSPPGASTSAAPRRPPSAPPRRTEAQPAALGGETPLPASPLPSPVALAPSSESDSNETARAAQDDADAQILPQPPSWEPVESPHPAAADPEAGRTRSSEPRIPTAPQSPIPVLSSHPVSARSHSLSHQSAAIASAGSRAVGTVDSTTARQVPELQDGLLRVSVKRSVRDETLLVLRPLLAGHAPPNGYQVGWLFLGDLSETDLVELRNIQLKH
jgi:hypothetical protein